MRMLRIALALPCVAVALAAQSPAQQAPATGVNPAYLDRAQAPCKDLYAFSNGAFDATPIPAAYASYGVNEEINERNEAILKQILEDALSAKDAPAGSVSARLRDFYASGMDTAEIEASGLKPIEPILHEIQALKSRKDLAPLLARLQAQGINAGPAFGVGQDDKNSKAIVAKLYQGGLGLPEREFYFRKDGKTREQRQAYVQHVARMFELAGDPADKAQKAAQRLLVFETKLAKVSRKLVDLRDPQANYHKMERRTLDKMAPGFGWPLYFRTLGLPDGEKRLVVGQPEFLQGFARLTGTAPLEDVKTYLRWHLLNATAEYLGKDLESADFDFYGKTLRGRKEMFPRWKRVLFAVDRGIGEDLGQAFVKRAFSPEAKAKVLEMVRFHREALKLSLQRAPWMSDATKTQALHKLETMNAKVGYPDQWRDYSEAGIKRQPYVLNALAANAFEFRRRLAKLGKPVDRSEWEMTPQTNNAYYTPVLNEIVLPAGILQPPFFSETADDASNYGALASTIGHELLHGFDDEGSQYNADGNLKNWWTAADRKAYDALTAKVAAQYDAFEVQPGLHIDGRQTLGENLADIGGLKISFEAWKLATAGKPQSPKDGLSPEQRFFVAFAQGWRTNTRPEALRLQVQSDVHSPVRWRVNGPAAALPEVSQVFGCPSHADATPIW